MTTRYRYWAIVRDRFGLARSGAALCIQRLRRPGRAFQGVAALVLMGGLASANTIALGDVAFNTLIPSALGSPGVNDFAIDNFTGGFSLPPDFPASDALTFLDSSVVLTLQNGTQQTINLGNLGPGSYTPIPLQLSAATNFTSAIFSATLSPSIFSLSDGSSFQAANSQIVVTLLPVSGTVLVPDRDFALISASNVPEPESGFLVLAALFAATLVAKRHTSSN